MSLSEPFIRRPVMTAVLTVSAVLFGVLCYFQLPVNDLQTAITQATGGLPVDLPSPPTFSKTNPNDQPIMYIALTSDSVTAGRLYDYASTQVGQRISILPGVSSVNVFGTKTAVRIKADPSALAARGITMDELSTAIQNGTSYTGA